MNEEVTILRVMMHTCANKSYLISPYLHTIKYCDSKTIACRCVQTTSLGRHARQQGY